MDAGTNLGTSWYISSRDLLWICTATKHCHFEDQTKAGAMVQSQPAVIHRYWMILGWNWACFTQIDIGHVWKYGMQQPVASGYSWYENKGNGRPRILHAWLSCSLWPVTKLSVQMVCMVFEFYRSGATLVQTRFYSHIPLQNVYPWLRPFLLANGS